MCVLLSVTHGPATWLMHAEISPPLIFVDKKIFVCMQCISRYYEFFLGRNIGGGWRDT